MIIDKMYRIKWHPSTKEHFIKLGYNFTKIYDEFEVNVFHLNENSSHRVECICDYCGKFFTGQYKRVIKYNKQFCLSCKAKAFKENYLKRTGYDNPRKNPEVKDKIKNSYKETMLSRYGVENCFQLKQVKEQIKETNLKNRGVAYPSQSQEVRKKIEDSCEKHYGKKNPMQSKSIRSKAMNTMIARSHGTNVNTSETQETLWLAIGGELNYKLPETNYHLDIAFPQDKICIEIDGSGHFVYNDFSDDAERERKILSLNWKILRVEADRISPERISFILDAKERLLKLDQPKLVLVFDNVLQRN